MSKIYYVMTHEYFSYALDVILVLLIVLNISLLIIHNI